MITAEDIKLLASSGEGYNVEFKITVPSKVRELTEEICAFANAAALFFSFLLIFGLRTGMASVSTEY